MAEEFDALIANCLRASNVAASLVDHLRIADSLDSVLRDVGSRIYDLCVAEDPSDRLCIATLLMVRMRFANSLVEQLRVGNATTQSGQTVQPADTVQIINSNEA